jgi:hypothetical protein
MKNQNSSSKSNGVIKPPPSDLNKRKDNIMDNANKLQQIYDESNSYTTTDSPSIEYNEKVNERRGCQLCVYFK